MDWIYEQNRVCNIDAQGELLAEATFHEKADGVFDIDHTYVAPQLRGRGIADEMLTAVAGLMRQKNRQVTASCSYANVWLKRHSKDYADIISKDLEGEALACRIRGIEAQGESQQKE